MSTQEDLKVACNSLKGSVGSVTVTLTVSTKYNTPQEIVDDAANSGYIEYATGTGTCKMSCNIRDIINLHGTFPTKTETLVSGFGTQETADRIAVIQKFVAEGGDINGDNGVLMFSALRCNGPDILTAVFDLGARVCASDGQLFYRGNIGSVFNNSNSTAQTALVLLKHLAHTDYTTGTISQISQYVNGRRLEVFEQLTAMPDSSIDDYVIFLMKCIQCTPDLVAHGYHNPRCPEVIAALVVRCGIAIGMSPAVTKCIQHEHFRMTHRNVTLTQTIKEKLARLEKIDAVLKTATL